MEVTIALVKWAMPLPTKSVPRPGLRALALGILWSLSTAVVAAPPRPQSPSTDHSVSSPGAETRAIAAWAVTDARGLPFLVVDKRRAKVTAFDSTGRQVGSTAALLGLARGDDSVPGIGDRKVSTILPHERTTPAGRFNAELGTNTSGEDILWVDYDAAVSMHRLRTVNRTDRRAERLATRTPEDNRISYGCINVPASFYDSVVRPLFEPKNGVVYVLPETRAASAVFGEAFTKTIGR